MGFAGRTPKFANGSALQLALREVQRLVAAPRFWIGMAAAVLVLTVSGPFGTRETFSPAPRAAYWAAIAVSTFLAGLTTALTLADLLRHFGWARPVVVALSGVLAGVPVGLLVWAINAHIVGTSQPTLASLTVLVVQCMVISLGVTALYDLVTHRPHKGTHADGDPSETDSALPERTAFHQRLAPETGTAILTLQAQDHYVEVVTTRGRELVLVRLTDAIGEIAPLDGCQVHRSWWVARDAIASIDRDGGRTVLTLTDDRQVPVSRGKERQLRAWLG